ncbi:MAG: hypothetical protein QM737_21950 [Ferruginibacter sp.]
MIIHSININFLQGKILDLDADEQGQFIAFTDSGTVITHDKILAIDKEIRFPIIRRLDLDTFLIAESRTDKLPNGHIYNFNGQLLQSFLIGDGIQNIVVHNNKIVATYFDEGVFGDDGPNNDGLAIFDLTGHQLFGFNSTVEDFGIDDCYCICKHKTDTVLFYAYAEFKLCELNVDTFEFTSIDTLNDFAGASAISGTKDKIIFHSAYKDKTSFFSWDTNKNDVVKFGSYPPPLKGIGNGYFLSVGNNGFTIINSMS